MPGGEAAGAFPELGALGLDCLPGAGRVAVVELRRRLRADGLQAFAVQFGRDFGEAFPRGR